ncbi:DUF2232 domain-containing protein [Candidatus Entotheonella palauensis]|uniref:DUF2232 domain-containing protein n=1 Tax=Candidatus Entotheonella palauensis TaxID=93172 RepID=UPI000B7FCB7F|nr:DUF2232 domain-containing protein [Candidatus Entotheonella palauensis]
MMTGRTERYAMALLSCLFTLIPVIAPMRGLIFSLVAPAPLVVLGAKHPWRYSLSVLGFEIAVLLFLQGPAVLFTVFYYALAPLVMAQAIRLRYTITRTITWSVVIPCGLNMLLLAGYSAVVQESPLTLVERTVESLMQVAQEQMPLPESSPDGSDEADEDVAMTVKSMSQVILMILPAMMLMNFLFTNVVNYVLVRWYFGRGQPSFVIDPEDLGAWHLTDHMVWVFVTSGIMLMLPSALLNVVGWNVFILTLALYLLHGIAIAVFWLRRLPLPVSGRWLLVFIAFLFVGPLLLLTCIAAGLFDIWLDFRRQRQEPLVC